MPTYIGVRCKSVGCDVPIFIETTEDTRRSVTIPLKTTPYKERIVCQICGEENEYTESDLQRFAVDLAD